MYFFPSIEFEKSIKKKKQVSCLSRFFLISFFLGGGGGSYWMKIFFFHSSIQNLGWVIATRSSNYLIVIDRKKAVKCIIYTKNKFYSVSLSN